MLTWEEFSESIATEIQLPIELAPDLKIVDDLALDSLELVELLAIVATMAPGFDLPSQMDIEDVTLGDLYHFYSVSVDGDRAS